MTIGADLSLIMLGAGAIIGIRVGASLLIPAIVCYGMLGPWVIGHDSAWIGPHCHRRNAVRGAGLPALDRSGGDRERRWPAPAAQVWAVVARVLAQGFGALPRGSQGAQAPEKIHPVFDGRGRRVRHPGTGISMFIGAFLAWVFAKLHAQKAERDSLAIAAGFIAASRSWPSWSQR
jgi:hypothetical protein